MHVCIARGLLRPQVLNILLRHWHPLYCMTHAQRAVAVGLGDGPLCGALRQRFSCVSTMGEGQRSGVRLVETRAYG